MTLSCPRFQPCDRPTQIVATGFVIGGISAWYILNKLHSDFFALSFKIVLAIAIAVTPLQIYIGHLSGEQVYHYQPTKLAAMEAQWKTIPAGESPPWSLLAIPKDNAEKNDWEISIPGSLSYILEIKPQLSEPVQGLKAYPPEDCPHQIGLVYYAFRIMIAIWFFLAGLMAITVLLANTPTQNYFGILLLVVAALFMAALGQGFALGAILQGIAVDDAGHYCVSRKRCQN